MRTLTDGRAPHEGRVSGHALKALRRSAGLTQERIAERLAVDITTLQGWESGRRPLASMSLGGFRRLRQELLRIGVQPSLVRVLDDAVEADDVLAAVLSGDASPLSTIVATRRFTELLLWPLTETTPDVLGSVGTPRHPALDAEERREFTGTLRKAAEHPSSGELLKRQCVYLAGLDTSSPVRFPTRTMRRGSRRGWSPTWVTQRSAANTAARQGDPAALQQFVEDNLIGDDVCETANLNYWAYWLGEINEVKLDDSFMVTTPLDSWRGAALLRHLIHKMYATNRLLDLDVHTLWALVQRKPYLLREEIGLNAVFRNAVEGLLEGGGISARARGELESLLFAIRMVDG